MNNIYFLKIFFMLMQNNQNKQIDLYLWSNLKKELVDYFKRSKWNATNIIEQENFSTNYRLLRNNFISGNKNNIVTIAETKSEIGNEYHNPSKPKKIGITSTSGIKKSIWRDSVKANAGRGLPIA